MSSSFAGLQFANAPLHSPVSKDHPVDVCKDEPRTDLAGFDGPKYVARVNKLQSVRQYATIVIVRDWTHSEEMHTWLQGNGERELKFTHDERRERCTFILAFVSSVPPRLLAEGKAPNYPPSYPQQPPGSQRYIPPGP